MKIKFKDYQVLKLKNYYKQQTVFIIVHCIRPDQDSWRVIEQQFKKHEIIYYKPTHLTQRRVLEKSIFSSYIKLSDGSILFLSVPQSTNGDFFKLKSFLNKNKTFLVPIAYKMNNKKYSNLMFEKKNLNFKCAARDLVKCLDLNLKLFSSRSLS